MKSTTMTATARIALFAVALMGCTMLAKADNRINYTYDNAHLYTAGNGSTTEKIHSIDIDWVNGDIKVVFGDVKVPTWKETATPKNEDNHLKMHYLIHNGELEIRFCQSGHWQTQKGIQKDLLLTLPRNSEYSSIDIETVNGDIRVAVRVAEIGIETVNGDVNVHNLLPAKKINIESVNGSLTVVQPADKDFVAEYETVNGKFSSDIPGTYSHSRHDGEFYAGTNPVTKIDLETVNGNMRIEKAK